MSPARRGVLIACLLLLASHTFASAAELTGQQVLEAIDRGKRYLQRTQKSNGSWVPAGNARWRIGTTSLALLALINTGETKDNPVVAKGLDFLRKTELPDDTSESSLMIQALAAAKDGKKDLGRILSLVNKLERWQIPAGENAGSWGYGGGGGGDRSNGQFAILGLREAQEAGVPVDRKVWERARQHWILSQNPDGGWGYTGRGGDASRGSMTVAGIASLVITDAMVRLGEDELLPDGTPNCCTNTKEDDALKRACDWLGQHFSIARNPETNSWYLYYMYGLERAGRLSGKRFFGEGLAKHDWYREGAEQFVATQSIASGSWRADGIDGDETIATTLVLLYLSKGFAPVLINKLEHGPRAPNGLDLATSDWNRHPNDVRNLTQYITGLPKWPKLLNWQTVSLPAATLPDLLQAPVLFLNGSDPLQFTDPDVALLREFVSSGGFLYAEAACRSKAFDASFRELVTRMYPPNLPGSGDAKLKLLPPEHAVFRAEFPLDPSTVELWGVDVGCRTSIIYSPNDWACLWDKWTSFEVPKRPVPLVSMIDKANRVGVNVIAYATGRELVNKLDQQEQAGLDGEKDRVARGLIEIARIRHTGGWDAAPQAIRNLMLALNKTSGALGSTKVPDLTPLDVNLFNYPILYMHGRNNFTLNQQERDRLKEYLSRGGLLFADSCCGAVQFDKSFRELVAQLLPEAKLERIPADHEMFSAAIGHDLRQVRRRELDTNAADPSQALQTVTKLGEPFFEGVQLDGKFVVIYSKYDLSCALERQAAVNCSGYVHEDAVKLAVNIVLFALLQ